ncbi:MAG TPA: hypothetical protein VIA06_12720 [Candidatus Dormibacteraeota bacterium]|jgi:hypothetical protein|nr:hypothetical protein [Candidatus Dormibacteraeota bacterium]
MSNVPLSGLLARALGDLTAEFVIQGAGQAEMPSAPMWFGFLHTVLLQSPASGKELPKLTRLSKRAVRQLAGAAVRAGWMEVLSGTGVHTTFGPTDAGRVAADSWMAIADSTEQRWCRRVGADHAALKEALAALVGQLDLEWPHYPISYGGDLRVTGGRFRPGQAGPPRVPAHGQDWAPVIRGDGDTVSALTLTALLSQLLVAFSVDYEEACGDGLVIAEGFVRSFGSDNAVPMKDLPPVLGVNGRGSGGGPGLERHGKISVRSDPADAQVKVAHLTTRGQGIRDRYAGFVAGVEADWEARFGLSSIAAVRGQLEPMLPAFDPALADALIASMVRW